MLRIDTDKIDISVSDEEIEFLREYDAMPVTDRSTLDTSIAQGITAKIAAIDAYEKMTPAEKEHFINLQVSKLQKHTSGAVAV